MKTIFIFYDRCCSAKNLYFKISNLKLITGKLILFCCLFCVAKPLTTLGQASSNKGFKGPVIFINLMMPSADSLLLVDGTAAMYAYKFSDNVDDYDAIKLPNFNENISLMRNGHALAIEARGIPAKADTLFVHMWGMKQKAYAIQVVPQNIPELLPANGWLIDKYLHTKTAINFYNKTVYNFQSNTDTSSYSNRFMLVFTRTLSTPADSSNKNGLVTVYPNPVTGNTINFKISDLDAGNYVATLTENSGKMIFTKNIEYNGFNNNYSINTDGKIKAGIYTLLISNTNSKKAIHLQIIVSK